MLSLIATGVLFGIGVALVVYGPIVYRAMAHVCRARGEHMPRCWPGRTLLVAVSATLGPLANVLCDTHFAALGVAPCVALVLAGWELVPFWIENFRRERAGRAQLEAELRNVDLELGDFVGAMAGRIQVRGDILSTGRTWDAAKAPANPKPRGE